jgi:hypothetical protein
LERLPTSNDGDDEMKTTIELAREVKATAYTNRHYPDRTTYTFGPEQLKAFADLVRADERNSWPAEMEAMERQVNILTDALAAEREACAKTKVGKPRELKPVGRGTLLDEQQFCFDKGWCEGVAAVRAAIRERGNK